MSEPMVKIIIAADEVGVAYKTIYNWLEEGSLKLAHPGFVFMSEVRKVWIQKQNTRADISRTISSKFTRDDRGRFKLLSGGLNNKTYKDID
jgi:predicted site-specific integrase-resolvase